MSIGASGSRPPTALPDFLGIGAQKAGTTWLHENLQSHPGAFLPTPKEVHFFDWKFDQGLETYARLFGPGIGKVKGEITPAYGILPPARLDFIRKTLPRLKLIFLMRNPIERAWSHAMMSIGWQIGRSYEQIREAELVAHFRSDENVARSDYESILGNWLARYDRDRLFVGFFDDIVEKPTELLKAVFAHLGMNTNVDLEKFPYRKVVYSGNNVPMPDHFRQILLDLHGPRIERLAQQFGEPVRRWLEPRMI